MDYKFWMDFTDRSRLKKSVILYLILYFTSYSIIKLTFYFLYKSTGTVEYYYIATPLCVILGVVMAVAYRKKAMEISLRYYVSVFGLLHAVIYSISLLCFWSSFLNGNDFVYKLILYSVLPDKFVVEHIFVLLIVHFLTLFLIGKVQRR